MRETSIVKMSVLVSIPWVNICSDGLKSWSLNLHLDKCPQETHVSKLWDVIMRSGLEGSNLYMWSWSSNL